MLVNGNSGSCLVHQTDWGLNCQSGGLLAPPKDTQRRSFISHKTCVFPRGVVHTALNTSPQPLVRGPVSAVNVPAEACVDEVHLRWDKFVLTFATVPRAFMAVHLTEQKLLRQLQVNIHTADTGVLP